VIFVEDEKQLVEHIYQLAKRGYPITVTQLRLLAYQYAKVNGLKGFSKKNQAAGRTWANSFMERHDAVTIKKCKNLSVYRAMCANPQQIYDWFDIYEEVLRGTGIMNENGEIDGSRVWNVDETGLCDVPGEENVVSFKYLKPWRIVPSEHGTLSTVLSYVNANGHSSPPMVIHKGARKNAEWTTGAKRNVQVRCSDTGYIKGHLFLDYAKKFVEHLLDQGMLKEGEKHIVLLDGHNSHIFNIEFIDFMTRHGIEVLAMPAHSSHVLQPLDGTPFARLKALWKLALSEYNTNNHGMRITKKKWFGTFNKAWYNAITADNIKAGFKMTGIVPLDRSKIDEKKLGPSETTDNPLLARGAAEDSSSSESDSDSDTEGPPW